MTTPPTGDAPTPEQRLAALESAVGQLVGRVTRLEAALATRPAPPPPQPTPRPVAPPPLHVVPRAAATPTMPAATTPAFAAPPWLDLEQLVGRYGAIGFALLALLAGVGTFVSWAARQGLLGPELRVGGGYLLGVALAVVGVRLRGTRRTFANALLACALGCIHAASWGAGPRLHLVPSAVALAVVAAASGALAWLALREDEDVLFLFGAAGAAVAPFIVSDGGGQPLTLAFYGVLVFLAAAYGLGARPWHTALRLVLWIVPGYLGALASMPADAPSAAFAIPLFAAGLWAAALVAVPMHAPRFARWGAIGLLAGAFDLGGAPGVHALVPVALALVGMVGAQVLFARAERMTQEGSGSGAPESVQLLPVIPSFHLARATLDTVLLPIVGLVVVTAVTPVAWVRTVDAGARSAVESAAVWAVAWAAGAACLATRDAARAARHATWPLTATLSLAIGAAALLPRSALAGVLYALVASLALATWWLRDGPRDAVLGGAALLGIGALVTASELLEHMQRAGYGIPFTSRVTLLALATLAAALLYRATLHGREDGALVPARRLVALGAASFTFVWGYAELDVAWSHDLSTALLTLYVGVSGAAAIRAGLHWRQDILRRAGLVLGGWCAIRTFGLASDVQSLALRVGLYFLAAGIGLAVAWMYTATRKEASG